MFVFDASPLIVLASADRLSVLDSFDRDLVVPERVRSEVVDAGLAAGYADARRVEAAVDDGLFAVRPVEQTALFDDLASLDGLGEADAAVIAHATVLADTATNDAVAVMDESYGRSVAAAEGVTTRGTAYLVLSLVERGELFPEEGRAVIDDLVDGGWYCSTDLYRRIVAKLDG